LPIFDIEMAESVQVENDSSSSYIVLLSGSHVIGKEILAKSLSEHLNCPWISADMAHGAANFGARSQARKGYDYSKVFGRIWLSKLRRIGFLSDGSESEGESKAKVPRKLGQEGCTAILSVFHMRKPGRDAIRDAMLEHSIRPIFVIMHITQETLSGRTLGAEEPELAERIMAQKRADIQEPHEDERDVILVDSMRDLDTMLPDIKEAITRQLRMNV
jgi:gluconate kinase